MRKLSGAAVVALIGLSAPASALCTIYPHPTLGSGTLAKGSDVTDNFACAALTDGSTINALTLTGTTSAANIAAANYYSNAAAFRLGYPTSYSFVDLYGSAGNLITFGIGGSEKARFGYDGSFLIGTTANGGWTGTANLEVKSKTSAGGTAISAWNSITTGQAGIFRVDNTGARLISFDYQGTNDVGYISTNGTSTAYNTTSDARLKNTRVEQRDYREVISKLWVGDFRWKKDGRADFGILAQQAYALFPQAIQKPVIEAETWQADYSKLAPLAIWGVKDLYRSMDAQDRKVSALERQLTSERQANVQIERDVLKLLEANGTATSQIEELSNRIAALEHRIEKRTAQR